MLISIAPCRLGPSLLILLGLVAGMSPIAPAAEEESKTTESAPDLSSVADNEQPLSVESLADLPAKLIIGATAIVREAQSQLVLRARVDTGAASCSIHCEKWKIEDEADDMEENIGKEIRILISNEHDQAEWVESRIDHCVVVKTAASREMRYKVPMTLRWNDIEREVAVTLNNRGKMDYPLLLGRNFLRGTFLVDIDADRNQRSAIEK
jgi:hypothetical protein